MRVNDEPSPRLAVDAVASVTAKRFFIFMFLCRMPSEAGFFVPVADRLGRAVGGLLEMNLRRFRMECKNYFYFFENIFSENA